MFLTKYIT